MTLCLEDDRDEAHGALQLTRFPTPPVDTSSSFNITLVIRPHPRLTFKAERVLLLSFLIFFSWPPWLLLPCN
jgi:hypothetical protein